MNELSCVHNCEVHSLRAQLHGEFQSGWGTENSSRLHNKYQPAAKFKMAQEDSKMAPRTRLLSRFCLLWISAISPSSTWSKLRKSLHVYIYDTLVCIEATVVVFHLSFEISQTSNKILHLIPPKSFHFDSRHLLSLKTQPLRMPC